MNNYMNAYVAEKNKIIFDYIPYGFQYYRAPTPKEEYWERDLKKLAEDGYNIVKYWIQWRWNQPEYNRYDFSDIDKLMDLAEKYGLKVILNIILDVAPTWLEKLYPDVGMITNRGEKVYGQATECRQIGGAPGPCFHHKDATEIRMQFVEVCASRYKDHPALAIWDVWNEPELTVGIKREVNVPDLMCYCHNSHQAFKSWCEKKYQRIEKLNSIWGRNYNSFEEVEMPRRFGTTSDMIDWRLFFCDTITEDLRLRVEAVKKYDKVHPVMCHTVPPPLFNSITCCSDDFKISALGDMVGNSVGSSDLASSILRSTAKGKTIINSEIHAVVGKSLIGFTRPDFNDLLKHIFVPLLNGVRGFVFWQYSPEKLGLEAPAWGNIDLKGRSTPWDINLQKIHKYIKENEKDLLYVENRPAEIGVFIDPTSEIGSWAMSMGTDLYSNTFMGMFNMFHKANYQVEFFSEKELFNGEVNKFKTICFPSTLCMNSKLVNRIKEFAENGGNVLLESYAGLMNTDTGMHSEDLPGCGLAKICGLTLEAICSTEMIDNGYDNVVHNIENNDILPFDYKGTRVCGAKYMITYHKEDKAEVVASFDNGMPALYKTKIGKGSIYNATTLISYGSNIDDKADPSQLLYDMFGKPNISYADIFEYGIRVDEILSCNLFIIRNNTKEDKIINIPFEFEDQFDVLKKNEKGYMLKSNHIAVLKIK